MSPRRLPACLAAGLVALLALTIASVGAGAAAGTAPRHARPASAATSGNDSGDPLRVRLTDMSPASLPVSGKRSRVVLTGTVTNTTKETWTGVQALSFLSSTPITTAQELEAARETPSDTVVGSRLLDLGAYSLIGTMRPGQSVDFRLKVPRYLLPTSPGVYWIGVHALGTDSSGQSFTAGRVRTFIPVARSSRTLSTALLLPIRGPVRRASDGRLLGPGNLARIVGPEGRLERVVHFAEGAAASGHQVTWLIDPALISAVEDLAAGNPPLSLRTGVAGAGHEPTPRVPGATSAPSPSGQPSPTPSPSATVDPEVVQEDWGTTPPVRVTPPQRRTAQRWLVRLVRLLRSGEVLALPYGDPDVSALSRRAPRLLTEARLLTQEWLRRHQIAATAAVAPVNGYLRPKTLLDLPRRTLVILGDHADPRTRSVWRVRTGQPLLQSSDSIAAGGPSPSGHSSLVAMRQLLLARAALDVNADRSTSVIAAMPPRWNPADGENPRLFFSAWQQPWLVDVGLRTLVDGVQSPLYGRALSYPPSAYHQESTRAAVQAARMLAGTGDVLGQLLGAGSPADDVVRGNAMAAVSEWARSDPARARWPVLAQNRALRRLMRSVSIEGSEFVTLSGLEGTITVSVFNRMPVPVTVRVSTPASDGDVSVSGPRTVTVAAEQRTTIRLQADAHAVGVHRVTLVPESRGGERVGSAYTFTLRTSEVGRLIWVILIVASVVLLVAVTRQIIRRVAAGEMRTGHDPDPGELHEELAAYDPDEGIKPPPADHDPSQAPDQLQEQSELQEGSPDPHRNGPTSGRRRP